ncbi:tRNA (N6-threonylcarbamoyladenosine(37)-N6)-methyltransferase TrmO [Variovorax sp. CY25R-8]|uniref:tRNA (N6-threonylcarbamoyladenosine(37)-N6)-methyltransferase TrmO n=1 Tax=Variovorax sp. CY25R-8 TaxID=2855501 RepID=UPI0021BA5D3A|nr:tRNA (N6-threonylcarbamoyladenosine(37)-N6)-methyltransferase TrmO [Variovorax sp. CY25R-8]MCT8179328.1 tRNA (N6-threonylcarbamoyladenosine(37)-N6)-methyltransferase TrmO [Variovorax sp. CY25R-8]
MSAEARDEIVLRPVGVVRSHFTEATGMPIQTAGAPEETGRVEVHPEFVPGLRDIEGFDYLILITRLHACENEKLEVVPFLDDASHGVFATRAPARPNRLGLSIVRLTAVEGGILHFSGNDMMDGTPVLDIKPYVPRFDVRETGRVGWFGARLERLPDTRSDDRMR